MKHLGVAKCLIALGISAILIKGETETTSLTSQVTSDIQVELDTGPLTEVASLSGGRAFLPCDVTAPLQGDMPILILFYKANSPIYSIDARNGPSITSHHWSAQSRLRFETSRPHQGLLINSVMESDDDIYRCRVDFDQSGTRNLRIKLQIVVPPKRLTISTASGMEVTGIIGPFPPNATLTLNCQVEGGSPLPRITWWLNNSLYDVDIEGKGAGEYRFNTLTISSLQRQDLYSNLTCLASNSNLTHALSESVLIDMSFPPSKVEILEPKTPLSEAKTNSIVCQAFGSRPAASISWLMNGQALLSADKEVHVNGNATRSTLYLKPSRDDNGSVLSCRADNSLFPEEFKEAQKILAVHYKPELKIKAAKTLDLTNIKEGNDVYFECEVRANPPADAIKWFRGEKEIRHDVSLGIIQSGFIVVLQGVTRMDSGLYTCKASNAQGEGSSQTLELKVKYSPSCAEDQMFVFTGGRHDEVNISCKVDSQPHPTEFFWALNATTDVVDIPKSKIKTDGNVSIVTYIPHTNLDFGVLLCWSRNEIGKQEVPCAFKVMPATAPEPAHNCTVQHSTNGTGLVEVSCLTGWDGGLRQDFSLDVRKGLERKFLFTLHADDKPVFAVPDLSPGSEYLFIILATNAQGDSPPVTLSYASPIDIAEKRMSPAAAAEEVEAGGAEGTDFELIAVLLGAAVAVLLCLVAVLLLLGRRIRRRRENVVKETSSVTSYDDPLAIPADASPDVILVSPDGASDEGRIFTERPKASELRINPAALQSSRECVPPQGSHQVTITSSCPLEYPASLTPLHYLPTPSDVIPYWGDLYQMPPIQELEAYPPEEFGGLVPNVPESLGIRLTEPRSSQRESSV